MRVFNEYSQCPKCGYQRGPETKPAVAYCDGAGQKGQSVCDVLDADGQQAPNGEHLHRQCPRCGFMWSEATANVVAPLSADEIVTLRQIIAEVKPS